MTAAVASTSSGSSGSSGTLSVAGRGLSGLRDQFRQLPRILQVGAVAVLLAGGYALCKATTWQWSADTAEKADALQRELDLAAARPSVDRGLRNIVLGHGEIRLPEQTDMANLAMLQAYQDLVWARKDVEKVSHSQQSPAPIGRGSSATFVPPGRKAEKTSLEISFDASPEVAAEVIADLESSPAIDAISSVKIIGDEKGNNKKVKVRLTVEAWAAAVPSSNRR